MSSWWDRDPSGFVAHAGNAIVRVGLDGHTTPLWSSDRVGISGLVAGERIVVSTNVQTRQGLLLVDVP